jgi:hypothetical protein
MTEEFNLSEKITSWLKEIEWARTGEEDYEPIKWEGRSGYEKEDVKEFIRKIKFNSNIFSCCDGKILVIDYDKFKQLAGEQLIK